MTDSSVECHGYLTEREADFLLEEYRSLRDEIERHDKHREKLHYGSVIGSFALWAWIIPLNESAQLLLGDGFFLILIAPGLVVLVSQWLAHTHIKRSKMIGSYVREIEKVFLREGFGWERYISAGSVSTDPVRKDRRGTISKSSQWLTFAFVLANFYISYCFVTGGP